MHLGYVTSENNGGFVGIRTKPFAPPLDMAACRGVTLKLKGDGKRLKCILRDSAEWNGIAWSYSFDTKNGQFSSIKIPFTKLTPTKFAKTVSGLGAFNSQTVNAIQLTLSKFEYDGGLNKSFKDGPFNIEIDEIRTF